MIVSQRIAQEYGVPGFHSMNKLSKWICSKYVPTSAKILNIMASNPFHYPNIPVENILSPDLLDPTFGHTGEETDNALGFVNLIAGSTFAIPENGAVSNIAVWLYVAAGGTVKGAIYNTSNALQGSSNTVDPADFDVVWAECSVSPTFNLTTGSYRICGWSDIGGSYCYRVAGTTNQFGQNAETYGTWPDPISWDSQGNYEMNIHADYTATGGGAVAVKSSGNIVPQLIMGGILQAKHPTFNPKPFTAKFPKFAPRVV